MRDFCQYRRGALLRAFPNWQNIPAEVQHDPTALARYRKGLLAIASHFAQCGDGSFYKLLRDDTKNPVFKRHEDLTQIQPPMESDGEVARILMLHAELIRNLTRNDISNRLRLLGSLGAAYYRNGDKAKALEFTQQALELCQQSEDAEGISIYSGNLQHIRNSP